MCLLYDEANADTRVAYFMMRLMYAEENADIHAAYPMMRLVDAKENADICVSHDVFSACRWKRKDWIIIFQGIVWLVLYVIRNK